MKYKDELIRFVAIEPASKAIALMSQHVSAYKNREQGGTLRMLWLVESWTVGAGVQEVAEVIDSALGEYYDELEGTFEAIGAFVSVEYLRKARECCGGQIPTDELERAELVVEKAAPLFLLHKEYKDRIAEEVAECFVTFVKCAGPN